MLAWLPGWAKKLAVQWAIGKFLRWLNDLFSARAAAEVEKRQQAQKDLDARPPDPDSVDDRLGNGSA